MNFIEELRWRGMLHDMTPGAEEKLAEGPQVAYIGFDPTAQSLTIGNYVQVMMLSLWQRSGNKPIVLMGGATGRVGDPSGKDKERQLKSYEELDQNLERQIGQFKNLLKFGDGPTDASLVNNLDFYKEMNILDFLRKVGKTLTVSYMMSKDSVKNRLESGLSFTEFSYQLLQAYDFQCLYEQNNCAFQIGGSDQWGNITSGTEFIRRNSNGKAYAVTTPLLTKADGSKFGKSTDGNIWMDAEMTSPYKFYQFWINSNDADLPKYFRYFSFKNKEEIESLETEYKDDPRQLKKILAEELTRRVHSDAAYESVMNVSELLFSKNMSSEKLSSLTETDFQAVKSELPSFEISRDKLSTGINIQDIMSAETSIVQSKGEAKRAIGNNAVSLNKQKIQDTDLKIGTDALLLDKYLMIENGKKNKFLLSFS